MEIKFYYCRHCGNVIVKFVDAGPIPSCCGEEMEVLKANVTDGKVEKHLPVVSKINECTLRVDIGSEPHPMTDDHYIEFVFLETEHGGHLHRLNPGVPAVVTFCCTDKVKRVYSFCNLHGLWKTELCKACESGKKLDM